MVDAPWQERTERGAEPGGLARALRRISAGEASVLVLERLGDAAATPGEALALIDWLRSAGAELVALDAGLDTASPAGRGTVQVLRALAHSLSGPRPDRPPRGRPGIASTAPLLAERISTMRSDGMSLRAIARALEADGVPTPRGGAGWRASSVQAALGYRRPPPPPPPPPPPGAPQPPGASRSPLRAHVPPNVPPGARPAPGSPGRGHGVR